MNFNLTSSEGFTLVTRQFKAEALPDIMLEIELFLKGCGYYLENLTYEIPGSRCGNKCLSEREPL